MKLGVVSDTHDNLVKIHEMVNFFNDKRVDAVLHAGDIIAPFILLKGFKHLNCPFHAVYGNNDGDQLLLHKISLDLGFTISPPPRKLELSGTNILLLHAPDELEAFINSKMYSIIIYGHTHQIVQRRENNCLILNPGEGGGWISGKHTAGIIDLASQEVSINEF